MLAIGRALMSDPKVLLLDEPSLGLAPQLVDKIGEIIAQINAQGTAVVLVEQNAAMALKIAHHAVVLEVGQVALRGPRRGARRQRRGARALPRHRRRGARSRRSPPSRSSA